MASMMRKISELAMLSGLVIILSITFASFVYMIVCFAESIILWTTCTSSFMIGTLMFLFLGYDFREMMKSSNLVIDDLGDVFILSYPILIYPTVIFPMIFTNELILIDEWYWFSIHGIINLTGYILYFSARSFMKEYVHAEKKRRRRGKRSPISKREIQEMAENKDFVGLCRILHNDVNFRNRELAAHLLEQGNDENAVKCLLFGLDDDEISVRIASSISLLKFERYEGKDILETVAETGYRDDRVRVIKALRKIDLDWAVRLVERVRDDDDLWESVTE
ncbi:MAG: HEAT repeat domain-containing protein [Candidatus Thorarchaeota archaeon]|nr:HEAT repeat domain-containing protein [Candidatus Thorarchaeota archaeon]